MFLCLIFLFSFYLFIFFSFSQILKKKKKKKVFLLHAFVLKLYRKSHLSRWRPGGCQGQHKHRATLAGEVTIDLRFLASSFFPRITSALALLSC